ncbi:MAG: hypothetical protein ACKVQU_26150 [Burkholderiales bacterium]
MRTTTALMMALALLSGCASFPQPATDRSTVEGRALLVDAARAHGWEAYRRITDISVSYDGEWRSMVARLQPILVDSQFRGNSEERMIVASRQIGQAHRGPGGTKQVARAPNAISVWYNDQPEPDEEKRAAAALVADGYRLFLFGPLYLLEREAIVEHAGNDVIDGIEYDKLFARLRPGLGNAPEERVMLWIGKKDRLTRRIWISADGLPTTQGVIAEIDLLDYRKLGDVYWPTEFVERLKRPFPLEVHRWSVTGIDLDRGFSSADIAGPSFLGAAAKSAAPLPALRGARQEAMRDLGRVAKPVPGVSPQYPG